MSFLDSDELYELKDKKQMQTITRPATTSAEPAKRAVPKKIIYKTLNISERRDKTWEKNGLTIYWM